MKKLILLLSVVLIGCAATPINDHMNKDKPEPVTEFKTYTDHPVERSYDPEFGVVCYGWPSAGLSCVKVDSLR